MDTHTIYQDMAVRTGGNIYIGVVGPVRTGKSTFIKRFMETLVLPGIEDVYRRGRGRGGGPRERAAGGWVTPRPPPPPPDSPRCR